MDRINQRRHTRLKHQAKIKVFLAQKTKVYVAKLRDFSESGLFLICRDAELPPVGAIIEVQTTEFSDAPIQTVKVVRVEPGHGIGVQFTTDISPDAEDKA